jgi:hypothetical protein
MRRFGLFGAVALTFILWSASAALVLWVLDVS